MRLLMSLCGFDEGQKYTRHHDSTPKKQKYEYITDKTNREKYKQLLALGVSVDIWVIIILFFQLF